MITGYVSYKMNINISDSGKIRIYRFDLKPPFVKVYTACVHVELFHVLYY